MTDWVEIGALVLGPVAAVSISLWREHVRQERERKLGVMRQLLLTRSNAGDPAFSSAIALTPIEFGHDSSVMTAWEDFTSAATNQRVTPDHTNNLVKQMMLALGYGDRAASQVAREAYVSEGLVQQRLQVKAVLEGIGRIADASEVSAKAVASLVDQATRAGSETRT